MQRILCLLVCTCLFHGLSAQVIHVDQAFGIYGTSGDFSGSRNFTDSISSISSNYSVRVKQLGLVYGPRVDLVGNKFISLSLAMPLTFGFAFTNNYRSYDVRPTKTDTIQGIRGTRIAFSIPVFADINIGLRSASDEERRVFGIFFGAGYGYSFAQIKTSAGIIPFDRWEPVGRAGIRMGQTWEKRWSIIFNIHGEWTKDAQRTYGLQVIKDL